jgi:hypothetical protein
VDRDEVGPLIARRRVPALWQLELGFHYLIGTIAGVDLRQSPRALHEEARTNQQHHRERHFGDDERRAEYAAFATGGGSA